MASNAVKTKSKRQPTLYAQTNMMEIANGTQAIRVMTIAFKLTNKMIGKSDARRSEIRATAKRLIEATENYMILERVKYSAGIEPKKSEESKE